MTTYRQGDLIAGKYRICGEIGGGAMGAVFRAEHELIHKPVAIKILHGNIAQNAEYVQRFQREAQAAAELDHPNICTVSDFAVLDSGDFYLVMELLEGETLSARLQKNGRMGALSALRIMRQLLSALQCAGEHGVVHRDVKPDNIFLVSRNGVQDVVKLIDFGIAHKESCGGDMRTLTQAGQIYGTPQYISPEQIQGEHVDNRADLYSSGIIFYELLMGVPPFLGGNYVELMHKHLTAQPPHLDAQVMAGDKIDPIVQKLLQKNPGERFNCANEAIAAIDEILVAISDSPVEIAALQSSGSAALPISILPVSQQPQEAATQKRQPQRPKIDTPLEQLSQDILDVLPKTPKQRRTFVMLVIFSALGILLVVGLILVVLFYNHEPQEPYHDASTDTVIYPEDSRKPFRPAAQPFNYGERYKVSHDSVLSKNQNIVSAAENLLMGNADAALTSLSAVKDGYETHPNFLRIYLLALYKVEKKQRNYDEIFNTFEELLKRVPDATKNPYIRSLAFDFLNSKDHYERMSDILLRLASPESLGFMVIESPYDRYRLRLARIIEIYDAKAKSNVPPWLAAGVELWRFDPWQCDERRNLLENLPENLLYSDEFYQNIIAPLSIQHGRECKRRGIVKYDCNSCLREFFKEAVERKKV